MFPREAEDLFQVTIIKVMDALPKFGPTLGRGSYYSNFTAWARTIGRNAGLNLLKKNRIRETVLFDDQQLLEPEETTETNKITDETIVKVLETNFSDLLTKKQLNVVKLFAEDKKPRDISLLMNETTAYIRLIVFRTRAKIEEKILTPAKFKRLPIGLRPAARKGKLRSIKILGLYYSTDEDLDTYNRALLKKTNLEKQGIILLYDVTEPREYSLLLRSGKVIRLERRVYIKKSDLEMHRKSAKRLPNFSPSDQHVRVAEIVKSNTEYYKIGQAIRTGRLNALRYRGSYFVHTNEYSSWVESGMPTS